MKQKIASSSPANYHYEQFTNLGSVSVAKFGNESFVKNTDFHQLVPTKERRISPDGNCLFSSLSFVITGADRFQRN